MIDIRKEKQIIRNKIRQILEMMPTKRRAEAEDEAYYYLVNNLEDTDLVLSFFSFKNEFSTEKINRWLQENEKLVLPRVEGNYLKLFSVPTGEKYFVKNKWGINEPNPQYCREVTLTDVTVCLVPGLAFDNDNNRIGYGLGFYDRLLSSVPKEIKIFGLGFKEQFVEKLPTDSHDIKMSGLLLFWFDGS